VTDQKHDRNSGPLGDFEEFQERRYDYGGQVPQLRFASRRQPSRKVMRDRQRLGLVGLSIILILVGMALPGRFGYFALTIVGIWVFYETLATRGDKKAEEREKRHANRLNRN